MPIRLLVALVLTFVFSSVACAQSPTGQALTDYVHGNEIFGRKLLLAIHAGQPEKNVAISPFPLSQAFGALSEGTVDRATEIELSKVFEWQEQPFRAIASRMLSARIPREKPATAKQPKPPVPGKPLPPAPGLQETFVPLSQSSVFLYRGKDLISSRFMDRATSDYGISFQQAKPGDPLVPSDPTALELYKRAPGNLVFAITTFTDLRTAWLHNLFTRSPQKLPFTLRSGTTVESDQMVSSVRYFRHVRNEEFEAVELPCGEAYLLVVLPAPRKDLAEIEKRIAADELKLEPMLQREQGDVTFPVFRIHFREDLQPPLESLGLKKVFSDPASLLAMVNTPEGALLTTTQQQVDLDVDDWGIKARAVTFMGGVLGGVVGGSIGPPPRLFHMIVNRPFLFFIRDNATNVLLFLGAEMNPTAR